jgi:hypothetical protein
VSLFIDSLQRLQRLRQQHRSWSVRRRRSACGYRKYRTKLRTWTLRLVRQLFRSAFSAHFTCWPLTRRLPSNLYTIHLEHLAFGLREFGLTGDLPWLSTTRKQSMLTYRRRPTERSPVPGRRHRRGIRVIRPDAARLLVGEIVGLADCSSFVCLLGNISSP